MFFDEFIVGMDVYVWVLVWELIDVLCCDGVIVVLIMYYFKEVEEFVDWLVIIDYGVMVVVGILVELMCSGVKD